MKKHVFFISFIVIVVAVVSVLFCFVDEPEHIRVVSYDNIVEVDGFARESQDVNITVLGNGEYLIEPSNSTFENLMEVKFDISGNDFDNSVAIYKYNNDLMMWEAVSGAYDAYSDEIVIMQSEFGRYCVKEYVDIDLPDFVNTFDEVLSMAPENTVGYELAVGFAADDGSIIRISEKTQLGGCDGVVENGNRQELSQLERKMRVFVDSVEQELEFLVIGRWFVNDVSECESGQVLKTVR